MMSSGTELRTGAIIDGHYEILGIIGGGGMGIVYRARELELGRIVALKVLHNTNLASAEDLSRFEREGQVLSRLSQRNVALLYRFGMQEKMPYIAMEYVEGKSLAQELTQLAGPLGAGRTLKIGLQVCAALAHAHSLGIVHRDIKPGNIVLLGEPDPDFVKVIDFGLARLLPGEAGGEQKLTQTGLLVGTVLYMSPEQCLGKRADERSDIYALGCVLYECLSGEPPFQADNPIGMLHLHVSEPPARFAVQQPEGLEAVVFKALAKDAADRYQTMSDLAADLALVQQNRGSDVSAQAVVPGRPGRSLGNVFGKTAIAAGVVLVLGIYCLAFVPSLLLALVSTSCHSLPANDRLPALVACAQWLIDTGRSNVAAELLADVAPSSWNSKGSQRMAALDHSVTVDEAISLARACLLRGHCLEERGDLRGALALYTKSMRYCCRFWSNQPCTSAKLALQLELFKQLNALLALPGAPKLTADVELALDSASLGAMQSCPLLPFKPCHELLSRLLARRETDETSCALLRHLSGISRLGGRADLAVAYAKRAVDYPAPESMAALYANRTLFEAAADAGQWQLALDTLVRSEEAGTRLQEEGLPNAMLRTRVLINLGRYDEAVQSGREALSGPTAPWQRIHERTLLLRLALVRGETAQAASLFSQMKDDLNRWQQEPDSQDKVVLCRSWLPYAVREIAQCYADLHLPPAQALEFFKWCGKYFPDGSWCNAFVQLDLARFMLYDGATSDAHRMLNVVKNHEVVPNYYWLVEGLYELYGGNIDQCRKIIAAEPVASSDRSNQESYYSAQKHAANMAVALYEHNDFQARQEALQALKFVEVMDPEWVTCKLTAAGKQGND